MFSIKTSHSVSVVGTVNRFISVRREYVSAQRGKANTFHKMKQEGSVNYEIL